MDSVDRMFELLDKKKIEQKEFAAQLGVAENVVSTWRTKRTKSYRKYLPQIAAALDTTVEYLLTGEEKAPGAQGSAGAEIGPNKRRLLGAIDDLSEEELAILLTRIEKLKESRI